MAYAIFRTAKYKTNYSIGGLMGHHLREKPAKIKGLDPSRSHLNICIGAPDRAALFKAVRERIATCTRKSRPDANRVVELVATASPVFFSDKSHEDQKAYLLECVDFAKQKFGEANVVGAYLHFDEKTPHVHIVCVPLETSMRTTKKMTREITALNAGHFFGGKEKMIALQDEFAAFVQARGHDLKRGEPKTETNRDHVPVAEYWKEQKHQIDAAGVAAADLLNDAAMSNKTAFRRGSELDKEWTKVREKAHDLDKREAQIVELEKVTQQLHENMLPAKQLADLVARPELVGMLDFLVKNQDARDLVALLKTDPAMAASVAQNLNVARSVGLIPYGAFDNSALKIYTNDSPTPF